MPSPENPRRDDRRENRAPRVAADDEDDDDDDVGHAFSQPFCIILCLCHSQFVNLRCVRVRVRMFVSVRLVRGRVIEALPDKVTSNDISVHQSERAKESPRRSAA